MTQAKTAPDVPLENFKRTKIIATVGPATDSYEAILGLIQSGVKSYVRPVDKLAATKLTNWLRQNIVLKKGDVVVTASGRYPGVVGTTDTIKVRVLE